MTVNHVAELCICLHSRPYHADADHAGPCSECRCQRFNPVSPKASPHALHRGQRVQRRRIVDLMPGQRVLTGWAGVRGRVRLTDERTGAMVSQVVARRYARPKAEANGQSWFDASGQSWFDRELIITTDLGDSVPQPGGTFVLVLR